MTEQLRLDPVGPAEWAVRLDGRLLGHVVLDPDALHEAWTWWPDGGGVVPRHEQTRDLAVYRLLVGAGGLDFVTARRTVRSPALALAPA